MSDTPAGLERAPVAVVGGSARDGDSIFEIEHL
jgi:hypothetical protein